MTSPAGAASSPPTRKAWPPCGRRARRWTRFGVPWSEKRGRGRRAGSFDVARRAGGDRRVAGRRLARRARRRDGAAGRPRAGRGRRRRADCRSLYDPATADLPAGGRRRVRHGGHRRGGGEERRVVRRLAAWADGRSALGSSGWSSASARRTRCSDSAAVRCPEADRRPWKRSCLTPLRRGRSNRRPICWRPANWSRCRPRPFTASPPTPRGRKRSPPIFQAKERPLFDPLIVHLPDRGWLERLAAPDGEQAAFVQTTGGCFWPGPLTMLLPAPAGSGARPRDGGRAAGRGAHERAPGFSRGDRDVRPPARRAERQPFRTHQPDDRRARLRRAGRAHSADPRRRPDRARAGIDDGSPRRATACASCGTGRSRRKCWRTSRAWIDPEDASADAAHEAAPGQTPGHYAPRTPCVLPVPGLGRSDRSETSGWLGVPRGPCPRREPATPPWNTLSDDGDLREAATRLFAALAPVGRGGAGPDRRRTGAGGRVWAARSWSGCGGRRPVRDRHDFARIRCFHERRKRIARCPPKPKLPPRKRRVSKKESGDQCWPGYERVPGKKPGTKGSCKKKGS